MYVLQRPESYDLSFLSSIREITGYLLIMNVYTDYIPLTNLVLIRGKYLFKAGESIYHSIYISRNYNGHKEHIGLKELGFTALSGG